MNKSNFTRIKRGDKERFETQSKQSLVTTTVRNIFTDLLFLWFFFDPGLVAKVKSLEIIA